MCRLPHISRRPSDFFLKAVDAQITFATDSSGRATQLVLHQAGVELLAKRIPGSAN